MTVFSVITYLTPCLGVEQNLLQDLLDHRPQTPGSRTPPQGDPRDLLERRIGEHQIRHVESDELTELGDQRVLLSLPRQVYMKQIEL